MGIDEKRIKQYEYFIAKYDFSKITVDENYYYLDENVLKDIGVKEVDAEKYGNYIVKYDFDNIKVEVINTKGYDGKYTLTQLIDE